MSIRRSASALVSALVASALAILLGLMAPATTASAKGFVPFKGSVVAQWDNVFAALPQPYGAGQANFEGLSQVSHMGRSTQRGSLSLFPTNITDTIIPGKGTVTITAANGDTLTFTYEGLLYAATGEGKGTFTFTGGTGRFANATGSGKFYAVIGLGQLVNQPMTVELDGKINY